MNVDKKRDLLGKLFALITILGSVFLIVLKYPNSNFSFNNFFQNESYFDLIRSGFMKTIIISLAALILSVILGFILYIMKVSKFSYFRSLSEMINEIMLGTPLIVLVILGILFIVPALSINDLLGDSTDSIVGTLIISFYIAPYMSNIYQGAMSSIDKDQFILMELYDFSFREKYQYIIIPQLIKQLMPPLINNLSLIIKSSTLLYVIGYEELYYSIRIVQSDTFAFVEGYVLMWVLYLIITIPLSQLAKYFERRFA